MAGVLSTSRQVSCISSNKFTKNGAVVQQTVTLLNRYKSFYFRDAKQEKDYQHIMKSSVPTLHFQESLPRLPIPELNQTAERYLRAQQPLLDFYAYAQTKSYVDDFTKRDGVKLQNALIKEDNENKHTSYISKAWYDMYLSERSPLPINFNPFLVFSNEPKPIYNSQLVRATNLVISSLRFFNSLNEGLLEPEVYHMDPTRSNTDLFRTVTGILPKSISWHGAYLFKAFPLDMSQYSSLFNTTRIPEHGKDRIKHAPGGKHILVMKKGHFYIVDVIDENGNIMTPDVILGSIDRILHTKEPAEEHPLGLLTTEHRDVWAAARKHLESLGNSETLDLIDSSLFNLVLDDNILGPDPVSAVKVFLHADGTNRWFDKSFSLIVTRDGTAGINFEHSWGDGVAVLRYFNDVHLDSINNPQVNEYLIKNQSCPIKKLEFNLDSMIKTKIADAKIKYDATCSSLEVNVLDYQKFGRQFCKTLNISPDAVMQLAFQVAFDKITGRQATTYESCSTAAFKHGRTETVRPCTLETQKFCKALKQFVTPTKTELQCMIYECSKVHSKLVKEAAMGHGFDRHLFALRLQAEALGVQPALFSDQAYSDINHNILSTSTLTSDNLQMGAFGPVVRNGFGIGYSVWNDRMGSVVTNYAGHRDGASFIEALQDSLNKIHTILKL